MSLIAWGKHPGAPRRLGAVMALLVVAVCGVAAALPAAGTAADSRYYLALGDSLSTGYQPTSPGAGANTSAGYVNDLYAYESHHVRHLQLVDVGCPGDTTTSLLTGQGNFRLAGRLHCDRSGGSQLAAALTFLRTHHRPGEVPLITIDIGINDLNRCGALADPRRCLAAGEQAIATNLPRILRAIARAAPRGATLAQMDLYDTYLGKHRGSQAATAPAAFLAATRTANATIRTADATGGFRTAGVAAAFHVFDTAMTTWDRSPAPANVAAACTLTWACSAPPIGHNIHPNNAGYRVIARAFEQVVGRLP